MTKEHWDGLSFLDMLRPEPGWQVDGAILTTYSLELVALVAAMLALAGLDDERGSGTKVDFANAFERMSGRMRVLVQSGRIFLQNTRADILGIVDQFITEINSDEEKGSWHPKIALVKYKPEIVSAEQPKWRLWVGSRNLTGAITWDTGLLLIGCKNGPGVTIPGITELGRELASKAKLGNLIPAQVDLELESVRWIAPDGVRIKNLQLLLPGQLRKFPSAPNGIKKLIVVSPFLDGTTLKNLGAWGDQQTERYLLSTVQELANMRARKGQPLIPFKNHLLTLEAPIISEFISDIVSDQIELTETSEDEVIEHQALHAKIIFADHSKGKTLWLGSPNATRRGWLGPNVEVIAQLLLDEPAAKGLYAFLETGRPINLKDLPNVAEKSQDEEILDQVRVFVAARWHVTQEQTPVGPRLISPVTLHTDNPDVKLEAGLLTSEFVEWERGELQLSLPPVPKSKETELVKLRLSLGTSQCNWIQVAPMIPKPTEERDRHALAAYLNPRIFLQWLRSFLAQDVILDGGGEWHTGQHSARDFRSPVESFWWAPTLEEVLSSWIRNPETLFIVDRKVKAYLKLIRAQDQNLNYTEEDQVLLENFEKSWSVISQALISAIP